MGKNTVNIEIIAEVANAHQGNYKEALNLAKKSFENSADSVKFQIYFPYEFLSKNHPRYKHFKNQSFSKKKWNFIFKSLSKYRSSKKIYADVLGVDALKFAIKSNLDGIKIHSSDLSNIKILTQLKKYKNKIFISCGGSNLIEISNAIKIIDSKKVVLLHGFQSYPTSIKDVNFEKLKKIITFFGKKFEYGYQDHTSGSSMFNFYLPLISMGMGINYIEKHVILNRKKKGIDYFSSIEPRKLKQFINVVRNSELALLNGQDWFSKNEIKYREEVKKNWIVKKNLKKKDRLKLNDIEMLRNPEKGTYPLNFTKYNNREIILPIKKGSIIKRKHFKNKVCVTIVARSKSKRLKNKASLKIGNSCVLEHLFKRAKMLKNVDKIIFCTTKDKSDDALVKLAKKNNIQYFRGSTLNVLDRIMQPLKKIKPDIVVRITGDDILIDNEHFQLSLNYFLDKNFDYVDHKNLIGGTETEIFDFDTLKFIYENAKNLNDTEYLTNYIKDNASFFNIGSSPVKITNHTGCSMTIDTKEDYKYVNNFLKNYYQTNNNYLEYSYRDILNYCKKNPRKSKIKKDKIKINSTF